MGRERAWENIFGPHLRRGPDRFGNSPCRTIEERFTRCRQAAGTSGAMFHARFGANGQRRIYPVDSAVFRRDRRRRYQAGPTAWGQGCGGMHLRRTVTASDPLTAEISSARSSRHGIVPGCRSATTEAGNIPGYQQSKNPDSIRCLLHFRAFRARRLGRRRHPTLAGAIFGGSAHETQLGLIASK